jgi:hypothetical protein
MPVGLGGSPPSARAHSRERTSRVWSVLPIGAGSCRGRSVSRVALAPSRERRGATCERRALDGDLCAATGCPARGGRPGQMTQARSPGSVTGLCHRPAGAGELTGVRRRARRAPARQGPAGRRATVCGCPALFRSGPWWRSAASQAFPGWPGAGAFDPARRAGWLARRRCALEAVEKVVTAHGVRHMGSGTWGQAHGVRQCPAPLDVRHRGFT